MSKFLRPVWTEGLFLRPEHLQQSERYHDHQRAQLLSWCDTNRWGLAEFEVDADLLRLGKFGLKRAVGVFPDGCAFSMPDIDPLPPPIDLNENVRDQVVHLSLPLAAATRAVFGRDAEQGELHRYRIVAEEIQDNTGTAADSAVVEVGLLESRFLFESDPRDSFACISVGRIIEVTADKMVKLDDAYMPTVLNSAAAAPLKRFISELLGMLNQRAEALAARVSGAAGGASEIADFLMLQVINRTQPQVEQYALRQPPHPERMHEFLVGLAGELATFTATNKRATSFPPYQHDDLTPAFAPVIAELRRALSTVLEQTAMPIPIKEKKFGVRVALVEDKTLFSTAGFILAAKAAMPADQMVQMLQQQAKIGPVEKIRDLVNLQLPGVQLKPLSAAPRQIPYHSGYAYFEMDKGSKLWSELPTSGGVAMYFSDRIPELQVELWAIRHS